GLGISREVRSSVGERPGVPAKGHADFLDTTAFGGGFCRGCGAAQRQRLSRSAFAIRFVIDSYSAGQEDRGRLWALGSLLLALIGLRITSIAWQSKERLGPGPNRGPQKPVAQATRLWEISPAGARSGSSEAQHRHC